jgi:leader peptidase (prepilin peptidase) / N-methyltransferase
MFGSFALVLFERLGKDPSWTTVKSILTGRSLCDHTGKPLAWHELIPIVSYLRQWGKSAKNGKKISAMYLYAEIVTAAIFLLTTMRGIQSRLPWYEILFWCVTNTLMVGLILYDIQKLQLHFPLRIITTIRILLRQFLWLVGAYSLAFFGSIVLALIFVGMYYGAQYYLQRRYGKKQLGLGEGDIYMAFTLWGMAPFVFLYQGLFWSWGHAIQLILYFLIISSAVGLAIAFMLRSRGIQNKHIPFIPAMIIAFYILLWSGSNFIW